MTTTSRNFSADFQGRPCRERGNILIYVLMTMVIFAVIGVTMVSLFSTSISSSATANETRRAFYLAESGLRYGMSMLRQSNLSASEVNRLNNMAAFNVPPSGSFRINVFGAWFKSPSNQSVASGAVAVEVGGGKVAPDFFDKKLPNVLLNSDLYIVVYGHFAQKPGANEIAKVTGFSATAGNYTSFQFDVADTFTIGPHKMLCMAIQPSADQTFTPTGTAGAFLDLKQSAANIFPKMDGAFKYNGQIYFYRTAKEESGYFRLSYITPGPNTGTGAVSVATATDYILLAPNNYLITSRGTYANVSFGGDLDSGVALASHNAGDYSEPDIAPLTIADMRQNESSTDYFSGGTDTQGDYIQIGPTTGMGAMWYNQDLNLGGQTNYCTNSPDIYSRVGCFFGTGMRAFFTLEYSGSGEGLIFALLNGQLNQISSAGGDFEAPELLGYAGDSRLNNSGGFVDTSGLKGLRPPKMGLELDARRNYDAAFETKPTDFCSAGSLRQNTRNDPDPATDKDFLQYVYWGSDTVNVPCRTTPSDRSSLYDDNRHNPGADPTQDWSQPLSGVVNTSPVVSADGKTIYVASNNTDINPTIGRLNAIDLDPQGNVSAVWNWSAANGVTSPVLDSSGNIYVGAGNSLYAFRPNRSLKFSYTLSHGTRASKPMIGPGGNIYISIYDGVKFGYLYSIRPDGSLNPNWATNPQTFLFFSTAAVLTPDGSLVIVPTDTQQVYAVRTSDGLPDTNWGLTGVNIGATPRNAPGVGPGATSKGTVYIGAERSKGLCPQRRERQHAADVSRHRVRRAFVPACRVRRDRVCRQLRRPSLCAEHVQPQPQVELFRGRQRTVGRRRRLQRRGLLRLRPPRPVRRQPQRQCALRGRHGEVALFDRQRGRARYAGRHAGRDGLHRLVQLQPLRDQPVRRAQEPQGQVHHLRQRECGRGGGHGRQRRRLAEGLQFQGPMGGAHGSLPQRFAEYLCPRRLLQLPAAHLGAPVRAGRLQRRDRLLLRRHPSDVLPHTASAADGADHQSQPRHKRRQRQVRKIPLRLHVPDRVGRQPASGHPQVEVEFRASDRPDRHLRPGLARLDHLPVVVRSLPERFPISFLPHLCAIKSLTDCYYAKISLTRPNR